MDYENLASLLAGHFDTCAKNLLAGTPPPAFADSMGVDPADPEKSPEAILDRTEDAKRFREMVTSGAKVGEWVHLGHSLHASASLLRDWKIRRASRRSSYAAAHRESLSRAAMAAGISGTVAQIRASKK